MALSIILSYGFFMNESEGKQKFKAYGYLKNYFYTN